MTGSGPGSAPTPLVDVLLPVFNGAATIRSAVASMQAQTLDDLRILVVDDGSTDETPQILAELAAQDPRVQVLRKPNGGLVEALNHGLRQCRAEFIARHDADDLAYPFRLADQVRYLRDNPDCLAVGGSARHIDADGAFLGTVARFPSPDRADPLRVPALEPYLLHPFLLVRTAAMLDAGGYRPVLHSEDTDLYWRLQERGRLHSDPAVQGEYRLHAGSVSSQSIRNGRQLAVSSQVSALSAARRRAGRPDMGFAAADMDRVKRESGSLEAACAVFHDSLDAEEARHLRIAVATKLLEISHYRPYELEHGDCVFLHRAYAESRARLRPPDRSRLHRDLSGTAARLMRQGRWRDAALLLRPGLYPAAAGRLALRLLLPDRLRTRLGQAVRALRPAREAAG